MRLRFLAFVLYVIVELAVLIGLYHLIGFWWTFLLVAGAIIVGMFLVRSQAARAFRNLSKAMRGEQSPTRAAVDAGLVALSAILLIVPGVVSTFLGILLLVPPVRALLRPLIVAVGARRVTQLATDSRFTTIMGSPYRQGGVMGGGQVIDGDVVNDTESRDSSGPQHSNPALSKRTYL